MFKAIFQRVPKWGSLSFPMNIVHIIEYVIHIIQHISMWYISISVLSTANFCTKNLLSGGLTQPNSYF